MNEIEKSYEVERLVTHYMEMNYQLFGEIYFDTIDALADYIKEARGELLR